MTKELFSTCDCGAVQYKITGSVKLVLNCHCHSCRKRNGASYSTYCVISQDDIQLIQGQQDVATYEVLNRGQYPGVFMVHLGSLSEYTELAPAFNIYCESKLPWIDSISNIKSFEKAIEP